MFSVTAALIPLQRALAAMIYFVCIVNAEAIAQTAIDIQSNRERADVAWDEVFYGVK